MIADNRPVVLFICVHNAGRSQMAAALMKEKAKDLIIVQSAGSEPADSLNPVVVEALAEIGIDISNEVPKKLSEIEHSYPNIAVTMGCGDTCPLYPGTRYIDWEIPDPAGLDIDEVRLILGHIKWRIDQLFYEVLSKEDYKSVAADI